MNHHKCCRGVTHTRCFRLYSQQYIWPPNHQILIVAMGHRSAFLKALWPADYLVQVGCGDRSHGKNAHSQHHLPLTFAEDHLKSLWEKPLGFGKAAERGAWCTTLEKATSSLQGMLLQVNCDVERSEESSFESTDCEAERLKGWRQDTGIEKEHTLLSPTICKIFVPPYIPQLRFLLPGAAVASPALCNVGKEQWVSSISHSTLLKQRPLPLGSLTQPVKSKPEVPCRETLEWTLSSQDWCRWTYSNVYQVNFWLMVFHAVLKIRIMFWL